MRSAYYSKNGSYSRSANAESAEDNGRFPRTRAAAAMGLSVKAFDAGCAAADYHATEWHHVGRYANEVYYFDTVELWESADFWAAAIAASAQNRRAGLQAALDARRAKEKAERIENFRAKLIKQRDCTRPVARKYEWRKRQAWESYCERRGFAPYKPENEGDDRLLCAPRREIIKDGIHGAIVRTMAQITGGAKVAAWPKKAGAASRFVDAVALGFLGVDEAAQAALV